MCTLWPITAKFFEVLPVIELQGILSFAGKNPQSAFIDSRQVIVGAAKGSIVYARG
jgi:hypothetical protein